MSVRASLDNSVSTQERESGSVAHVRSASARSVAQRRGQTYEQLEAVVERNAAELFAWSSEASPSGLASEAQARPGARSHGDNGF